MAGVDGTQAVLSWAKGRLHAELLSAHRIEVPVFVHDGALFLRASCFVYNSRADLEALKSAVLAVTCAWEAGSGPRL